MRQNLISDVKAESVAHFDIELCTEAGEKLKADNFVTVKLVLVPETEEIPFEEINLDVE